MLKVTLLPASILFITLTNRAILRFKILYRINGNIIVHQSIPTREATIPSTPTPEKYRYYFLYLILILFSRTEDTKKGTNSPNQKSARKTLLDLQDEQKRAKSLNTLLATGTFILSVLICPPFTFYFSLSAFRSFALACLFSPSPLHLTPSLLPPTSEFYRRTYTKYINGAVTPSPTS